MEMEIIKQQKTIAEKIVEHYGDLKTPDEKIFFWNEIKSAMDILKQAKQEFEKMYIEEHRDVSVALGENKYVVGEKKTNRYDTAEIYRSLKFNPRQQAILPKNPTFSKAEVLKLQDEIKKELYWVDIQDKIEIKSIPKRLLKGGSGGSS